MKHCKSLCIVQDLMKNVGWFYNQYKYDKVFGQSRHTGTKHPCRTSAAEQLEYKPWLLLNFQDFQL